MTAQISANTTLYFARKDPHYIALSFFSLSVSQPLVLLPGRQETSEASQQGGEGTLHCCDGGQVRAASVAERGDLTPLFLFPFSCYTSSPPKLGLLGALSLSLSLRGCSSFNSSSSSTSPPLWVSHSNLDSVHSVPFLRQCGIKSRQ